MYCKVLTKSGGKYAGKTCAGDLIIGYLSADISFEEISIRFPQYSSLRKFLDTVSIIRTDKHLAHPQC